MCEGLTKRFHAVAFKKEGKKLAVLKAGGCLGKSAIAIAPPMNKSRRGDDDALQWPAEMPEARALLDARLGRRRSSCRGTYSCMPAQECAVFQAMSARPLRLW